MKLELFNRLAGESIKEPNPHTTHILTIGVDESKSIYGFTDSSSSMLVSGSFGNIEPKTFSLEGQEITIFDFLYDIDNKYYWYAYSTIAGQKSVYIINLNTLKGFKHTWNKFESWGQVFLSDDLIENVNEGDIIELYISGDPPSFEYTNIL